MVFVGMAACLFPQRCHAGQTKTHASPLRKRRHPTPSCFGLPVCHRWLHSRAARDACPVSAIRYASLHSLQPLSSLLAHGCTTCFKNNKTAKNSPKKGQNSLSVDVSNTPKHSSKVTGMVGKADKGSLRQPQKISTLRWSGRIFWSALAPLPPNLWRIGIMFYCIFRRRLASWWLVAYIHSSARIRFHHVGGSVPLVSLQLLWLQFSLSKLPF